MGMQLAPTYILERAATATSIFNMLHFVTVIEHPRSDSHSMNGERAVIIKGRAEVIVFTVRTVVHKGRLVGEGILPRMA